MTQMMLQPINSSNNYFSTVVTFDFSWGADEEAPTGMDEDMIENLKGSSDEGVYAWVVANYALGTLGGDPSETTGIIELGGASAQVTFVSREAMLPLFSRTVKFRNVTYNLYSHSLLHFGLRGW
ncbi:putative apyrase 6-like protein [Trifolium pratense]|uniref:Putative apyrase 6-like protein n=1 Tax=Trifolium pratense TaxID=57577 RepID=A0A2K3L7B1_TRIPR|nr:putative apyrase 6-like protein [Trifolium pratense]